jgi:PleD family two-component response regulator
MRRSLAMFLISWTVAIRGGSQACGLSGNVSDRRNRKSYFTDLGWVTDAPHILIVDDDAKICQMLTRYLTDEGFRVSSAENGSAMHECLARGRSIWFYST